MSSGLTHIGAIARGLAYAPAAPARLGQAAELRQQIRDEVMAERGMTPRSLFEAPSQDRILAETALRVETAQRSLNGPLPHGVRATGTLLDLRV